MKRTATILAVATLLSGAPMLTPPALAQNGGATTASDPFVSIDFAGGTVANYVDALRKTGRAVNIVVSERAAKQQLGTVSLNRVTVGVAVYAIHAAAASGAGQWRIDPISPYPATAVRTAGLATPEPEAYSVDFLPLGNRGQDVVVESYSLMRIIKPDGKTDGVDPKVVLTAIETGLKLLNEGAEQAPDLKFHPDSGLLFVRGSSADVRLVGSIVIRMMDDARARSQAQQRRERESALREIAIKEARIEIELREVELQAANDALEQMRLLVEKGSGSSHDVRAMEVQVSRARTNLERARLALERAKIGPLVSSDEEGGSTTEPAPSAAAAPSTPSTTTPNKSTARPPDR
ncbi:MAG: hypothetical protein KF678_00950 [Phycisphaeraceae bacterium]|nr:hypothetical protein [Phycisphaeraceae bacterium]